MPKAGHEQRAVDAQVRGREAERSAAGVARDDRALDLDRPAEQRRGRADVARAHELPDPRRRNPLDERHDPRAQAQTLEQLEVAAPGVPEAERLARDHELRPDRLEIRARELLRLERGHLRRELDDERLLDPEGGEQLEPSLERREQLHLVPEHLARMRVERHDRRSLPASTAARTTAW